MPALVWDQVGERTFETGLDRGVLYLPDGSAVPWNGLTQIIEKYNKENAPVYYDGMKISDLLTFGEFSATLTALTYPDEFEELQGYEETKSGVFFGEQAPQLFGLSYRNMKGSDLNEERGYKIHILYNLLAVPSDKTRSTISADPGLTQFEWELSAIPADIPGIRPTAHLVIDTEKIDPWLLEDIEEKLYGGSGASASLTPMVDLVNYINDWYRVKIIDNGNGTWTAITIRDSFILMDSPDKFHLVNVNAVYLDPNTYKISDTADAGDMPLILISNNGDGTWSASTDHDDLITMLSPDKFEINNATLVFSGPIFYRITNTKDS